MSNNDSVIPRQNVSKDVFGWEVPVETVPLPSKGVIYNPDSTIYNRETIQIKAMTALQEDILSSAAYISEGTSISRAIQSCITEDSVDVMNMIAGDRNALMVSMRITGYGSDYPVTHICQNCGRKNDVNVKLSELGIKRLEAEPVEQGKNLFSYSLPVTGKKVLFKFMTAYDEKDEEIKRERLQNAGIIRENSITSFLENMIVSIDGINDKNKIHHFIKNMPAKDSRSLRLYVKKLEPGIDMNWQYDCSSCGSNNGFGIPITTEFFWPST